MPLPANAHGQFERSEEYGRAVNFGGTLAAATSFPLRAANRRRKKLTVCNTGGVVIWGTLGVTAALNVGFPIYPQGVWTIEPDTCAYLWVGAIALISAGTPTFSGCEES